MGRYFMDISYDGRDYHGWQKQENAATVQELLEDALSKIMNTRINITGSGRTDTGVHAIQQIAHFDLSRDINPEEFTYRLNKITPASISINKIVKVEKEAHARFDAQKRSYVYKISNKKDPFTEGNRYCYNVSLDLDKMNEAASHLLAYENFQSFSKVKTEVKTFNCSITHALWERKEDELHFYITANRFLRGMVRAIVGTLLDIGEGKQEPSFIKTVIEAKDRTKAGRAVPAGGLFLSEVTYPEKIYI